MKRSLFTQVRRAMSLRRWLRVPAVLGVAVALVLGLGTGSAFAYFTSTGHGTVTAITGTSLTITVNATTGTADLYPGASGAAYFTLTNSNSFGATFNTLTAASVVSQNITACPSANISIVPTLPFALSPALTIGVNTTSAMESIPNLVELSSSAPNGCQGVQFTVTLTLTGQSR
jgi:hypothetical protein